jgi:membrane-associated protease RseP (regulator of RpoE activity)
MADPFSFPKSPAAVPDTARPDMDSSAPDAQVETAEESRPGEIPTYQPIWVSVAPPRVKNRVWLHALLFFLTILTTTLVGIGHWASFSYYSNTGILSVPLREQIPSWYTGFWYSATILVILGAHELGHYFACRYYRIDASLPYFLPLPPPFPLTGTLGAFIRIREPVRTKRQLFDIGIAGPLAGFIFAVPALFIGLSLSNVVPIRNLEGDIIDLGEPLLFKLASWTFWGPIRDGYTLNLHPMAFAAWFGLLATALNLFPVGQLDGGHISYTVFGRRSTIVTIVMIGVAVSLAYFSLSLVLWTVLMVAMLFAFGAKHPPVMDEDVPIDRVRFVMAIVALVIFILCFTPAPIRPVDLIR